MANRSRILTVVAVLEAVAIVVLLLSRGGEAEPPPSEMSEGNYRVADDRQVDRPAVIDRPASEATASTPLVPESGGLAGIGIIYSGTVTAEDGTALDGAVVTLTRGDKHPSDTVQEGTYSVTGLTPGTWSLTCEADGCFPKNEPVDLRSSRPHDGKDFVLQRQPLIPVRFRTPDGKNLLNALSSAGIRDQLTVVATMDRPSSRLGNDVQRVAGWHGFGSNRDADAWDGELALQVPLPVWVSIIWQGHVIESKRVTNSDGVTFIKSMEDLVGALATVRARIVDAQSRKPVLEAYAELTATALLYSPDQWWRRDATAPISGEVFFNNVPAGSYVLQVHPPGSTVAEGSYTVQSKSDFNLKYSQEVFPFDVRAGENKDLRELALARTILVMGCVIDASGELVNGKVRAIDLDRALPTLPNTRDRSADAPGGNFGFGLLPAVGPSCWWTGHWSRLQKSSMCKLRFAVSNFTRFPASMLLSR